MKTWRVVGFVCLMALVPAMLFAQAASGIAGVVRDTSGAVIPGVTVEAASPSLIEKVRTVVVERLLRHPEHRGEPRAGRLYAVLCDGA